MPHPSPTDPDQMAQLVAVVGGLEQAITGMAAILEDHGALLVQLLAVSEEKPAEEDSLRDLLTALITRLDQQQQTLQSIDKGLRAFNEALGKGGER